MCTLRLLVQGVSWNLGEAVSGLIATGAIPPCVCVAIDSPGPYRSYSYLPFKPGTGKGGFRPDAERWPGGGAHEFLLRLQHELLPLLQRRYGVSQVCASVSIVHLRISKMAAQSINIPTCLLSMICHRSVPHGLLLEAALLRASQLLWWQCRCRMCSALSWLSRPAYGLVRGDFCRCGTWQYHRPSCWVMPLLCFLPPQGCMNSVQHDARPPGCIPVHTLIHAVALYAVRR